MADTDTIGTALRDVVRGDVRTDAESRQRVASDYSIYRALPRVVVVPRDVDDIVATVRLAQDAGIPVTARGGGTSTAGSATGSGIVMLLNRLCGLTSMGAVVTHDRGARITVDAGVRHDDLQAQLREANCFLPADPSSGAISFIGGNIATKASGPHALKHGSIDRYLEHVAFVSADGRVIDTSDPSSIPESLSAGLISLRARLRADAACRTKLESRRGMKCASGYNLVPFLDDLPVPDLLAQCLCGSVGTLGILVGARLRGEPYEAGRTTSLLCFRSLREAGEAVCSIRDEGVAAIEIVNHEALEIVRARRPGIDIPAGQYHMLLVEYSGPQRHDQVAAVARLLDEAGYDLVVPAVTVDDPDRQAELWKARKALLPLVRNHATGLQAWSIVNDVGVDAEHLADFIRDVETIFKRHHLSAPIYGHAGSGNLHLRPFFDPAAPGVAHTVQRVADDIYGAVFKYGGTITGEHGMGRVRAPYLEAEWGPDLVARMRDLKLLFDPDGVLNPGVMFAEGTVADAVTTLESVRCPARYTCRS